MLQPPEPRVAVGVPRVLVSIEDADELRDDGTADRVKNQTLIPEAAISVTYTPPPAAANPAPYELVLLIEVVQPESLLAPTVQFGYVREPVILAEEDARQLHDQSGHDCELA